MARRTASPAPPGGDDDLAALYRGPLDEFIDARNRLATRLRQAGDTAESARVKALPKPSAPAWALNHVYWHAREDYDRLIAAGDRLRALQQQMLGGRAVDPRESMQERQGAVRQVVDRAARFLADAGHPVTDATRQRLNVTADALATWGSQPQGYVHGRLDRDIEPPGFAALASLGPPALRLVKSGRGAADVTSPVPAEIEQPQSRPTPAARGAPRGHKGTQEPTAAENAAARRALEKAAQEAERAREAEHRRLARVLQDAEREVHGRATARDRAASALAGAAAGLQSLTHEVASLERQLAALRARLATAESAHREAQTAAGEADRAHAAAEDAAARARRDLERLEKS
jgi:hypothetical protein